MKQPQTLLLHDIGACTPLGFCAASSSAAVWAGISRIAAPDVPIVGAGASDFQAACPILDADAPLAHRLAFLASVALTPMLANLQDLPGCLTVFVALCRHAVIPSVSQQVERSLQQSLGRLRGGRAQSLSIKMLTASPGNFAHSLDTAARYLAAPSASGVCIIGAVDSSVSPCRLQALKAQAASYDTASGEGLIPGEAAAFLSVGPKAARSSRPSLGTLEAWHHEQVPKTATDGCSPQGAALCAGVAATLAHKQAPSLWVSCASGESWRACALGDIYTSPKMAKLDDIEMLEPARLIGDTGVAFAPLACCVALHGIHFGLAPTTHALVTAQSRLEASTWLISARQTHSTVLDCDGPWRKLIKRGF